jgi:hypothetical protein
MRLTQPIARGLESLSNPALPLWTLAEIRLLDEALDYAARVSQGTVCEFLAAPGEPAPGEARFIQMAVEFFIPPVSLAQFTDELDRAMMRRNLAYSSVRRAGSASPVRVTALSPSVFHQWRMAWKVDPQAQRERRWSSDRRMLEQVLLYANSGWRELFTA